MEDPWGTLGPSGKSVLGLGTESKSYDFKVSQSQITHLLSLYLTPSGPCMFFLIFQHPSHIKVGTSLQPMFCCG